MPRDSDVYLQDILDAIERIKSYTQGLTREQFKFDQRTVDAVIRNLEIIGEAVKSLPPEIREENSEVHWKSMQDFAMS